MELINAILNHLFRHPDTPLNDIIEMFQSEDNTPKKITELIDSLEEDGELVKYYTTKGILINLN